MTLEEVVRHIAAWIAEKRTGSIQINMFKGGISNINLTQCLKTENEGEGKNGNAGKFIQQPKDSRNS
jgi:hypothetical protein